MKKYLSITAGVFIFITILTFLGMFFEQTPFWESLFMSLLFMVIVGLLYFAGWLILKEF